jgi:DNA polymerase III delta subunit
LPTIVLINGEEEFLKERAALQEVESGLFSAVSHFQEDDVEKLRDEAELDPISPGSRCFVLWGATKVPQVSLGVADCLICVAATGKPLKEPGARSVNFPKLKSFDDNNEVLRWIMTEGDRVKLDLKRVATALFVNSGKSLRKLSSEIRKLSVTCKPGAIVSPEEAKSVMCFSADLTPKSVIDAICDGQPARALAFYDKLQEGGDETGWVLAYLQRHVWQQLVIGLCGKVQLPEKDVASIVGIHPFVLRKMMESRTGLWSEASLSRSLNTLCDLDAAHRRSDPSVRLVLELEIARLSEESSKNVNRGN